jgi:hypothetical protein
VVSQETDIEGVRPVLENKSQVQVAAAFKETRSQFPDSQAAVNMRVTKSFGQIAEGLKTLSSPFFREFGQVPNDFRIKCQWFVQAVV